MVIGKRPVAFAEQDVCRHSDSIEQLLRDDGSDSVAAINYAGDGSRNLPDALADIFDVAIDNLLVAQATIAGGKLSRHGELIDFLNVVAVDGARSKPELEPVELRRIVRSRDLNSAGDVQVVLRPVCERRWDNADIDHIEAALEQTCNELTMQIGAAWPIVAANCDLAHCSPLGKKRGERTADCTGDVGGEILSGDTPDVVFAKDVLGKRHATSLSVLQLLARAFRRPELRSCCAASTAQQNWEELRARESVSRPPRSPISSSRRARRLAPHSPSAAS